jgi:hypothetical protein
MINNKRKPARVLTNVKIDEVSAVDHGAGEGCHVVLRKRDRTMPDFYKIFGARKSSTFDGYPPEPRCKNTDDVPSDLADRDDDAEREDEAARIAAEMDTDADRDESDDDDEITGKGSTMKSQLIDLAKRSGWRAICKRFEFSGCLLTMTAARATELKGLLSHY